MTRKRVGIIDIISFCQETDLYNKFTQTALYSIMPQVIGSYLKRLGCSVWYYPHLSNNKLLRMNLNFDIDILIISSYTMNAYLAYTISNIYRQQGIITILGGPHARSYPEDSKNILIMLLVYVIED